VLDVNQSVHLTLPAGACDVILRALGETPYRIAAPVIEMIQRQISEAHPGAFALPAAPPPQPETPPRLNGAAPEAEAATAEGWRTVQESR